MKTHNLKVIIIRSWKNCMMHQNTFDKLTWFHFGFLFRRQRPGNAVNNPGSHNTQFYLEFRMAVKFYTKIHKSYNKWII